MVKRYIDLKKHIVDVGDETRYEHTKKQVQMHRKTYNTCKIATCLLLLFLLHFFLHHHQHAEEDTTLLCECEESFTHLPRI